MGKKRARGSTRAQVGRQFLNAVRSVRCAMHQSNNPIPPDQYGTISAWFVIQTETSNATAKSVILTEASSASEAEGSRTASRQRSRFRFPSRRIQHEPPDARTTTAQAPINRGNSRQPKAVADQDPRPGPRTATMRRLLEEVSRVVNEPRDRIHGIIIRHIERLM